MSLAAPPISRRPRPSARRSRSVVFVSAISLISFGAAALLGEGRTALVLAAFACLAACWPLYHLLGEVAPRYLFARVGTIMSGWNAFWLLALALTVRETVPDTGLPIDYSEYPFRSTLPLLAVPICGLALHALIGIFAPNQRSGSSLLAQAQGQPLAELKPFSYLSGALVLGYWVGTVLPGAIGYFLRVLASTTAFMPYMAGRYLGRDRMHSWYWIGCMVVNGIGGLFTGARFHSFFPPLLYILGRITAAQGNERRRLLAIVAAGALPAMIVSGAIGIVRGDVGRVAANEIDSERVQVMITAIEEQLTTSEHGDGGLSRALERSILRMVPVANLVVPASSPEIVEYRGFSGYWEEIKGYADIAMLANVSTADFLDRGLGNSVANEYGFYVSEGNSVEFGLIPDAWSRGGAPILMLFSSVLVMGFILFEALLFRIVRKGQALALPLFAAGLGQWLASGAKPLLPTLRSLVLNSIFVLAIAAVLLLVRRVSRAR